MNFTNRSDTILRNNIMDYFTSKKITISSIDIVHRERASTSTEYPCSDNSMEVVTPPPEPNPNPPEPLPNRIKDEIDTALSLDLSIIPRPHRDDNSTFIEINNGKQATSKEKLLLLLNATKWGIMHMI